MKKAFTILLCTIFLPLAYVAAQPTGYYNTAENKSGEELKAALNDIISGHTVYSYFYSKEIFKLSDADPNNPNNVIEIYTGRSHANNDYGSGSDQLNREHIWAKSHGNFGDVQPMDGDVHNLKPIDASVNNDKSNLDYDNGGTQHPEATGCYFTEFTWEPRDEDKGDVARIIFYMDTRYEGENGEMDLTVVDEVNTYPYPKHGKLSTLLEWNLMDPPDDFERNRNNVIYSFQNNRNPFIDNPQFAELIWNDAIPSPITIANVSHSPEVPVAGQSILVNAAVSSTAGAISGVTLYYGNSWGNLVSSLPMSASGGTYSATIPGQAEGARVYFRIEASDGTNTRSCITYNFYVPKIFTGTLTSIYDIQGQTEASPFENQVVSTTGIVTANFGTAYFIQNGPGAWNGLYIYDGGRNPSVGDSVIVTGTIAEYYEKTEMKTITDYYFISGNHPLPAAVDISCAEVGEPYEGVIITVDNAVCTDAEYQSNFFMWTVNDGTGDLLVHNTSVFEYVPVEGEAYVVTGPLDYDFDEWKIQLRFDSDVAGGGNDVTAPQVVSVEVITPTIIKLQFTEELETTSANTLSNYAINNNITVIQAAQHSIVKSQVFLTVSTLSGGNYELTVQNVADLAGNVMPLTNFAFSSTGLNESAERSLARVFPNPAGNSLTLQLAEKVEQTCEVRIYNAAGILVQKGLFIPALNDRLTLDVSSLPAGLYLIEASGSDISARTRFIRK